MINISGHLRPVRRAIGFEDKEHPVMVNCCGYQVFNTKDYSQNRDIGRLDYQIIYIYKGCGHYKLQNQWRTLQAGNILLFRPSEPQVYSYFAKDKPEIYWIHFTGTACDALLEQYGIQNCYIGENLPLKLLFQETIVELQLKKTQYESVVISNFYKLLALICRSYRQQFSAIENNFSIDRLVMQLHQKYMDKWDISSMAGYCGLSEDYFSHAFKKRTGVSPVQFLKELRIEKAKDFLITNSMSISAVARLCGFDDPLYFSRVFKKTTGIAPRQFQQNIMEQHSPD